MNLNAMMSILGRLEWQNTTDSMRDAWTLQCDGPLTDFEDEVGERDHLLGTGEHGQLFEEMDMGSQGSPEEDCGWSIRRRAVHRFDKIFRYSRWYSGEHDGGIQQKGSNWIVPTVRQERWLKAMDSKLLRKLLRRLRTPSLDKVVCSC